MNSLTSVYMSILIRLLSSLTLSLVWPVCTRQLLLLCSAELGTALAWPGAPAVAGLSQKSHVQDSSQLKHHLSGPPRRTRGCGCRGSACMRQCTPCTQPGWWSRYHLHEVACASSGVTSWPTRAKLISRCIQSFHSAVAHGWHRARRQGQAGSSALADVHTAL